MFRLKIKNIGNHNFSPIKRGGGAHGTLFTINKAISSSTPINTSLYGDESETITRVTQHVTPLETAATPEEGAGLLISNLTDVTGITDAVQLFPESNKVLYNE